MKMNQHVMLRPAEQVRTLNRFAVKSKEPGVKSPLFKRKVLKCREEARRLMRTIRDLRFINLLRNEAAQDPYVASRLRMTRTCHFLSN